jgi:outer membrane lipoprotein-sorting protein
VSGARAVQLRPPLHVPAPVNALLLLLTLLIQACAGATCPVQRITDPAQAIAAQRATSAPIRSLRAEAKIDQRGAQGRIKGRILMFVERPDRVRFDAMTQFGPALILTSDGQNFALTDFKDNKYTTGPACARNIGRVVGVALSSADVASVLLGDAPLIEQSSNATPRPLTCGNDGLYLLQRAGKDGGREELELRVHDADKAAPPDKQRLYLASATLWDAHGTKLVRVRYEDYKKVGTSELPHTVRIDDFEHDSDALLRLSDVRVDVTVPEGAFSQTPRAGLKVEEVACEQVQ